MLRLVFVTGSLPNGGAERHTIGLLNALAERAHECHAVCVKPAADLDAALVPRGTVHSLKANAYVDWRAVADFAAYLTRLQPQVIVAANPYALLYTMLGRSMAGANARVVVTYHTTRLLNLKEHLQMFAYRPLFWLADCTVFLCQRQRRRWRRLGLFSRRNEVIYNGIDTETFNHRTPAQDRDRLRKQLGCGSNDYLIGISALLRVEKNHLQLIEAVSRLRHMGIPARALIIGDGELRSTIEARARALNLEHVVTITGLQQDVRPYIAACDVMTLCSVTETFSLAALEAMAMGKPIVLSDVGGAAEMIVPGLNGLLFPVGDTDAFVAQLATLSMPTAIRRMGEHARQLAEQRFSARTMVDRYEQLFIELAQVPQKNSGKELRAANAHAAHEPGA